MPAIPRIVTADRPLLEWARENAGRMNALLDEAGALLLRSFSVDQQTFQDLVRVLAEGGAPLEYVYRSTPRTSVGDRLYTATEYPASRHIPLHNENAYQTDWPMRLFFLCVTPAREGGETPIAATVRVTERIDPAVVARFVERGVMYVRNYRTGLDIPWQTVFQTDDRAQVEAFCRDHDIQCEWRPGNGLRTRQVCQAVAVHPRVGKTVWMNQAHLFHVSSLDDVSRESLLELFSIEDLPRNSYYGDGSPIEEGVMQQVREAFDAEAVVFGWQAGDVLVMDNMLVSHGRRPFKGDRRVLVAMSDAYSAARVAAAR